MVHQTFYDAGSWLLFRNHTLHLLLQRSRPSCARVVSRLLLILLLLLLLVLVFHPIKLLIVFRLFVVLVALMVCVIPPNPTHITHIIFAHSAKHMVAPVNLFYPCSARRADRYPLPVDKIQKLVLVFAEILRQHSILAALHADVSRGAPVQTVWQFALPAEVYLVHVHIYLAKTDYSFAGLKLTDTIGFLSLQYRLVKCLNSSQVVNEVLLLALLKERLHGPFSDEPFTGEQFESQLRRIIESLKTLVPLVFQSVQYLPVHAIQEYIFAHFLAAFRTADLSVLKGICIQTLKQDLFYATFANIMSASQSYELQSRQSLQTQITAQGFQIICTLSRFNDHLIRLLTRIRPSYYYGFVSDFGRRGRVRVDRFREYGFRGRENTCNYMEYLGAVPRFGTVEAHDVLLKVALLCIFGGTSDQIADVVDETVFVEVVGAGHFQKKRRVEFDFVADEALQAISKEMWFFRVIAQ